MRETFKCPALHTCKMNSLLDLNQNKRLLDSKN